MKRKYIIPVIERCGVKNPRLLDEIIQELKTKGATRHASYHSAHSTNTRADWPNFTKYKFRNCVLHPAANQRECLSSELSDMKRV